MTGAPRVVVAGAGIAGLTIAWELARGGATTEVLAGSQPRASEVAAGMLAPMPELVTSAALGRFAVEALRAYPEFLGRLAEDSHHETGFVRSGLLRVAHDPRTAESIRDSVGTYEAAGMPSQWLESRAVLAEAPGVGADGLIGGLLSFDEAQVHPAWLLEALTEAIEHRGGRVTRVDISRIEPSGEGVTAQTSDGRALHADRVILSMGSWSGTLPDLAYPVRPVKGQLRVYSGHPGPARMLYSGRNYLLTKVDGSVLLGATMEDAGFDLQPTAAVGELDAVLSRLWPGLQGAPATTRVGLRPAAPDGLPLVGFVPELAAVYAFTAHFRNGILLAPAMAAIAARELMGGAAEPALAGLRPDRLRAV